MCVSEFALQYANTVGFFFVVVAQNNNIAKDFVTASNQRNRFVRGEHLELLQMVNFAFEPSPPAIWQCALSVDVLMVVVGYGAGERHESRLAKTMFCIMRFHMEITT